MHVCMLACIFLYQDQLIGAIRCMLSQSQSTVSSSQPMRTELLLDRLMAIFRYILLTQYIQYIQLVKCVSGKIRQNYGPQVGLECIGVSFFELRVNKCYTRPSKLEIHPLSESVFSAINSLTV